MSDSYKFLTATRDDIPEIVNIYRASVGSPGCTWDSEYPGSKTAEWDIENKWLYILKKEDKIIAVASLGDFNELGDLQWSAQNPCELMRIGVLPEMRNQGIGTAMLRHIIRTAKEKGYGGIRMLVSKGNAPALAMYDKNGFERCGEVFRFDIDFFCYQIRFDPE